MQQIIIFLLLLSLFHKTENYRILGIFPIPGKSHMIMFERVLKELAAKGHEVDVVGHFPLKNKVPRYNDISIRGTVPIYLNNISIPVIASKLSNVYKTMKFTHAESGANNCKAIFASNVGTKLKNNKKYDLVVTHIIGSECMLGFAHHFKVPVVVFLTSDSVPWGGTRIGNPDNPSYITNYYLGYTNPFDFLERLTNAAITFVSKLFHNIANELETPSVREFFGPDLPSLAELASNTHLLLVNSHFSINIPHPNVPNFIEVGGLHIKPAKPLPKHLESSIAITSQYKGIIYLSMGSMILSETISPKKLQALFDAFRELPYKVLWKATRNNISQTIDIPSNIHFESWLPQADVLCHPNTKLFVTHGGLFGTQESIYCGVPSLGIPFYIDQEFNIRKSEVKGLAIMIKYNDITKENILNAARKLLEDPKYKINAEATSKLFKDVPVSSLDTAIYWIEYIIRHKGAPSLRSTGADLPWYQYFLIDVGFILISCLFIIVSLIIYISRSLLGILFKNEVHNIF